MQKLKLMNTEIRELTKREMSASLLFENRKSVISSFVQSYSNFPQPRLLESTRKFLETSEELTVENEAISTAISTFGLKKNSFETFDDSTSASDDSNLPSTSTQSPSSSRQQSSGSSSSSSPPTMTLESEAINSAISSYGLQKN